MLDQRRRRWFNIVQMLYKCFVFVAHMHKEQFAFIATLYIFSNVHLHKAKFTSFKLMKML